MSSLLNSLSLDLAFHGASEDILNNLIDKSVIASLTSPAIWQRNIKGWIQLLKNDYDFPFSDLIRDISNFSMGLHFTDDKTIAELNLSWRNNPDPTDVLSFPTLEKGKECSIQQCLELGDIIISVNKAESQAIEQKHSLQVELNWLVTHGLLHLLGWDHPNSQKLNEMLSCQEQLLDINVNLLKDEDLKLINH